MFYFIRCSFQPLKHFSFSDLIHLALHFFHFIFNWRIIILQRRLGLCHASAWVSHRCTRVPWSLNSRRSPSDPLSVPPGLPCGLPESQSTSAGCLRCVWWRMCSALLSQPCRLSRPTVERFTAYGEACVQCFSVSPAPSPSPPCNISLYIGTRLLHPFRC